MTRFRIPSSQHCLHVVGYVTWLVVIVYRNTHQRWATDNQDDPFEKYGPFVAYFSIGVRLLSVLIIPQMLALTVGLLMFDVKQPSPVQLKCSVALAPFVCIRMVTRGLYPTLVNQNVKSHLHVMHKLFYFRS